MPSLSLVVCVYKERDLLERLLRETAGLYDDLVVVHDGSELGDESHPIEKPASIDYSALPSDESLPQGYLEPALPAKPDSIQALVLEHGGRYFEGGRSFQQEPHWPFAWSRAKHDWILRLDADEFPSEELKTWLRRFVDRPGSALPSGYTCIWPLWNGRRAVTHRWPGGRIFFFHRQRVRFFGMVEEVPMPDTPFKPLDLVLKHQPKRKSYGVRNILFRAQAYHWRRVIAQSLTGKPTDLPCWRWTSATWPDHWERIRRNPLRHTFSTLIRYPLYQLRGMLKVGQLPIISACLNPGLHHCILGLRVFLEKRRHRNPT